MRATNQSLALLALALGTIGGGCHDASGLLPTDGGSPDGSAPDLALPPGYCAGPERILYDPTARAVDAFPDDYWTVDDSTSPTGLRVHLVPGDNLDVPTNFEGFSKLFDDLSLLDGFGTTAGLFLRLSGPLDPRSLPVSGAGSGSKDAALLLVDLDAPEPRFVDVEWDQVTESADDPSVTLRVFPMLPLEPQHHYALVLTRAARAAAPLADGGVDEGMDGGCVAPSPTMAALLEGTATDPALVRLQPRYAALVAKLVAAGSIGSATDLSAALVFTTQHTIDESAAIAADIRTRSFHYTRLGLCPAPRPGDECSDDSAYRCYEGHFDALDYRPDHLYVDDQHPTEAVPYAQPMPVTVYLPKLASGEDAGPYPTLVYGHGLGGDRHQACRLAQLAAPRGFATVAIDAVKHGDHPDPALPLTGLNAKLDVILDFFGFHISPHPGIDSRKMRDNWNQSAYDKLELLELLRPGLDADGDGLAELSLERASYLGVSLGGIMSAEFMAFAPELRAGVIIVPGARVTEIVEDGDQFSVVIGLFRSTASDGDIARFFTLLQTAIDRGDAGAYTRHIVAERLPGFDQAVPQVLMQMVIDDDTVPNSTNRFFARGLGVPHVGDELQPIGELPLLPAWPEPVRADLDATHTGGVFQYDVVWDDKTPCCTMGRTEPATHGNVAANPVAIDQSLHFLAPLLDPDTVAQPFEILDPYRDLGLKH